MDASPKYKLLLKYSKDLYSVRTFSNDGFPFDLSIFKQWRKARSFYKKLRLIPANQKIIEEYRKLDVSGKPLKP